MTAVNASTLGDENVENSKKLQQAVVGSKTVAADGTVNTTTAALTTKISDAEKLVDAALKTGGTAYNKDAFETAINTARTSIEKVLEDKNISKAAFDAFTVLDKKLEACKTLNTNAAGATVGAGATPDAAKAKLLNDLKDGMKEVSAAFEEAYAITNSQMTSLDELRTTLQGFVAKPNDVNLGYTSFTTFLNVDILQFCQKFTKNYLILNLYSSFLK